VNLRGAAPLLAAIRLARRGNSPDRLPLPWISDVTIPWPWRPPPDRRIHAV